MSMIDDATLLRMAEAEILGEAKRAAARHSTAGTSGWQPVPKPNKMFLTNTLLQTVASNRIHSRKLMRKSEKTPNKKVEKRLLQRKSKTDMHHNFVYKKPDKKNKIPVNTANTRKHNSSNTTSKDKISKNVRKEIKDKCNTKKQN